MNPTEAVSFLRKKLKEYELDFVKITIGDSTEWLGNALTYNDPNQPNGWFSRIQLSKTALLTASEEQVKDVCLHEMAHVIRDYKHSNTPYDKKIVFGKKIPIPHDNLWREIAREVGARPSPCSTFAIPKKFLLTCANPNCLWRYESQKRITNLHKKGCPKCNAKIFVTNNKEYRPEVVGARTQIL